MINNSIITWQTNVIESYVDTVNVTYSALKKGSNVQVFKSYEPKSRPILKEF